MFFFFFKQKTAYEMRISDWSSDVCSSDLAVIFAGERVDVRRQEIGQVGQRHRLGLFEAQVDARDGARHILADIGQHALEQREGFLLIFVDRLLLRIRSEEQTSELQSLMRISYAVFCL